MSPRDRVGKRKFCFLFTLCFDCAVLCQGQCIQFSSPDPLNRWRYSLRKLYPFSGWPSSVKESRVFNGPLRLNAGSAVIGIY